MWCTVYTSQSASWSEPTPPFLTPQLSIRDAEAIDRTSTLRQFPATLGMSSFIGNTGFLVPLWIDHSHPGPLIADYPATLAVGTLDDITRTDGRWFLAAGNTFNTTASVRKKPGLRT